MRSGTITAIVILSFGITSTACLSVPVNTAAKLSPKSGTPKPQNSAKALVEKPLKSPDASVGSMVASDPSQQKMSSLASASIPLQRENDETAEKSAPLFSAQELDTWCKKERRPRTWGPPGIYKEHLPWIKATVCKDRFTYRVKAYVRDEDADNGFFTIAVVHLSDSGTTEEVYEFRVMVAVGWGAEFLQKFQVGVVDGDGTAEVFIGIYTHEEGFFEWSTVLLTLKDGKLEPVSLPQGFKPEGIVDTDADGLFDVVTNGPYAKITDESALGGDKRPILWGFGMFLLHSRGGFQFSLDDEWAQKKIRTQCPSDVLSRGKKHRIRNYELEGPEPKSRRGPDWRHPKQIICARVHGQDANTVKTKLWKQCGRFSDFGDYDECRRSLLNFVTKDPPVILSAQPQAAD